MKVSTADITFSSQHQQESSHQYLQTKKQKAIVVNVQGDNTVGIETEHNVMYRANSKAVNISRSLSQSQIKVGDEELFRQRESNTLSIVRTSLAVEASIVNINLKPTSGSEQASQYKSMENRTDNGLMDSSQTLQIEQKSVSARVDIYKQHTYEEEEQLKVETHGKITTEDGREIDFQMELNLSRRYELRESFRQISTQRELHDPLIINLKGGTAALTNSAFTFDLNADGQKEQISFTQPGSGFLVLDLNQDGRINDGKEMFGTQGESGFSELAKYDADNNNWIDENDEIYSKLKVWTKDAEGVDQLVGLKEAGVGAIYLASQETSFAIKDEENRLLGEVKRTGLFLDDNGEVSTIQELDLAVHSKTSEQKENAAALKKQIAGMQPEQVQEGPLSFGEVLANSPPPERASNTQVDRKRRLQQSNDIAKQKYIERKAAAAEQLKLKNLEKYEAMKATEQQAMEAYQAKKTHRETSLKA